MSTTVELGKMRDQRDAAVAELDKLRGDAWSLADEWFHSGLGSDRSCALELRNLLGADS